MTHTPGPWRVSNSHGLCIVEDKKDGYLIADMGPSILTTTHDNANLIATAPELLEALERFVDEISKHTKYVPKDYVYDTIAKAKEK